MYKVKLIAAACENMGIGINNALPWKLRNEMKYFERMTTKTKSDDKQNVVIMGRKTWFSIPNKFRPLKNRINIVLSRQKQEELDFDGVSIVAKSLDEAMKRLTEPPLANIVESVWIVGGQQLYTEAIESKYCEYVYLTRIKATYECDSFFPDVPLDKYQLVLDEDVSDEVQIENGIEYKYEVYKRV